MNKTLTSSSANNLSLSALSSPWLFFALVLGWSWLFWVPAAVLKISVETAPGAVLGLMGLLGPMLGGILFTYLTHEKEGRRDYWQRVVDMKRIGTRWYLVIFLFVPILMGVTALFDILAGEPLDTFREVFAPLLTRPLALIPMVLSIFFIGPFPEELGWRGYVLDRLQARWNALTSSLILGVVWAIWHLPLFFIKDTFQYNQGAWTVWFWQFFVAIIPLAVVFTWVYNNTQRSTLAIILFHFLVNFTDELLNLTGRTNTISTLLWIAAAVVITLRWGSATFTGKPLPCPTWLGWFVEMDNPFTKTNRTSIIVQRLNLQAGMKVLDFGCGPGRVTIPLAKQVGPQGEVLAVDIQPGMLHRTQEKAQVVGLHNIKYLQAAAGESKLGQCQFDRAVLVTVLGEIPDPQGALAELFGALKPGGVLSVTEVIFDPHFQKREKVLRLANAVGFKEQDFFGHRFAYTLNLEKSVNI